MLFRVVCAAGLVGLLVSARTSADEKALSDEVKKAQGTWSVAEAVRDGEAVPADERKAVRLVITGDRYETRVNGVAVEKGTWKVVALKGKRVHIDIAPTDGPNRGQVFACLSEWVDGDTVRMCLPIAGGGPRPAKLTGERGSEQFLVTYQRAKE